MGDMLKELKQASKIISDNIGKIDKSPGATTSGFQELKTRFQTASGEISPVTDLFGMICSGTSMSAHAFVDTFDACIKGGWTFRLVSTFIISRASRRTS